MDYSPRKVIKSRVGTQIGAQRSGHACANKSLSPREAISEPIVCNTPSISRQVPSGFEPVVMVNGNRFHTLRISQPQVDPHRTLPAAASFQASPIRHAATCRAEVKNDPLSPCVGLGRTRDIDVPALTAIVPQRSIATTRGAIARGGLIRHPIEAPLNRTAVARTLDHSRSPSNFAASTPGVRTRPLTVSRSIWTGSVGVAMDVRFVW